MSVNPGRGPHTQLPDSGQVFILGAAGLAREMAELVCSRAPALTTTFVDKAAESDVPDGATAVLGIGYPEVRRRVYERLAHRLRWPLVQHPRSDVSDSLVAGPGVVIASGAIITTDVRIGAASLINQAVVIGHDAHVGQACVINPCASVAGAVMIGDEVLVGAGARLLAGLTIGNGAVIGAGAVVTHDVAAHTVVAGVPARPMDRS